jgi:hypothetical protein
MLKFCVKVSKYYKKLRFLERKFLTLFFKVFLLANNSIYLVENYRKLTIKIIKMNLSNLNN